MKISNFKLYVNIIFIFSILSIISFLVSCNDSSQKNIITANIGEVFQIEECSISINECKTDELIIESIEEFDEIDNYENIDFQKLDEMEIKKEKKEVLIVDLIINNLGKEGKNLSSLKQIKLIDNNNKEYEINTDINIHINCNNPDGFILPGETFRGKVGFFIDNIENPYKLKYINSYTLEEYCLIDLQDKKIDMPPENFPKESINTIYNVGETIKLVGWNLELKIEDSYSSNGSKVNKPTENYIYKILKGTIENKGQQDVNIVSYNNFKLKDKYGYIYDLNNRAILFGRGSLIDGKLVKGEKKNFIIGFEIPKDLDYVNFSFTYNSKKILVNIP